MDCSVVRHGIPDDVGFFLCAVLGRLWLDMVCGGRVWTINGILLFGVAVPFLRVHGKWLVMAIDGKNDQLVAVDDTAIGSRLYVRMVIMEKHRTYQECVESMGVGYFNYQYRYFGDV